MPQRDDTFDEDPLESDQDSNDDAELVDCPYCGTSISEDADICSHCGSFIIPHDAVRTVPKWVIWSIILGLAASASGVVMLLHAFAPR